MAKLNKEQLKKLYDYGGTLSPKDWADAMDSLCPADDIEPNDCIYLSYDELVHLINTNGIIPKQWYRIPYTTQGSITEVYVQGCTTNTLYENALCTGIPVIDGFGNITTERLYHCKYTTSNHIINNNVRLNYVDCHFDEIHTSMIPNLKDQILVDKCYISYNNNGYYMVIWNDNGDIFVDEFDGTEFLGKEFSSVQLLFENWTGFIYDIIIDKAFYSYDISRYSKYPDLNIILSGEANIYFIGDINKHNIKVGTFGFIYKSKIVNSNILVSTYAYDYEDVCITANNYDGIIHDNEGLFINSTIKYLGNTSNQIYVGKKVINSKLTIGYGDNGHDINLDIINCIYDVLDTNLISNDYNYDYITQGSNGGLYMDNYPISSIE